MSRYFDALNRLRRGRGADSRPDLRLAEVAATDASTASQELASGPGLPFPELHLASRQAAYATLLDRIRATIKSSSVVVVAGVSGGEPVREAVAGLELQGQRRGVAIRCGHLDLATGARTLHLSSPRPLGDSASSPSTQGRAALRLSGSQSPDALGEWLEEAAADSDLLLIEAPPISSAVEGALLGAACGGLILVAEALVTKRAALQEAIERVRLTGCEVLGVVLAGTKRALPGWLARLLDLLGLS